MKLMNTARKYGRQIVSLAVVSTATMPMLASAADGDIDVSKALLYIAGGLVAAGALITARMGLVSLIGAGKDAKSAAR